MEKNVKNKVRIIEGIQSGKNSEGQDARMLGEFLKMSGWETHVYKAYKVKKDHKQRFFHEFLNSSYRFLHISAHGDRTGFSLQDDKKTEITAADIQLFCRKLDSRTKLYTPLHKKFVTISSCGHVSADFVMKLHKSTSVTAVISALAPVGFSDSALFSSLFYFSLFNALQSEKPKKLSERMAVYVDAYQRTKFAYLGIGGTGAHRLDYWWNTEHVVVN